MVALCGELLKRLSSRVERAHLVPYKPLYSLSNAIQMQIDTLEKNVAVLI